MTHDLQFLIVDDFSTMRRIIASLLKELGYSKIYEAEDGQKALGLMRAKQSDARQIDIVITDWNMPLLDGIGLLKSIRSDTEFANLPVLMVTAEGKTDNIISAAKAGADGYILKPFNAATLKEKLDRIILKRGLQK